VISIGDFLIFLSAAFLLAISPGPGMLYVLARSLKGGKKVGLASSFGTAFGGMGHVIAAAFGLSAILAQSAYAFLFVKYLGAAYLVYLGIRTLFSGDAAVLAAVDEGKSGESPFWQGVLTEVLNPKTALFFLAFIPQFVDHAAPLFLAVQRRSDCGCASTHDGDAGSDYQARTESLGPCSRFQDPFAGPQLKGQHCGSLSTR
jgi:threonine/homoserine/homoserine lactone efflux protein